MATAIKRRKWPAIALALLVLTGTVGMFYRESIGGYGRTGAAFGARTACACRYIGGRALGDCEKDFEPGMQLVFLSEDAGTRSVTASVPLIASETARFRRGYGCVLDPWEG